jgi:preprotein translocase subunit SecA
MNFVNYFFSKIFGNKSDRDIKGILPLVDEINREFEQLQLVSNDELRGKTAAFKLEIKDMTKDLEDQIAQLKKQVEEERPDFEIREQIYNQIDKLQEEVHEQIKNKLDEILPQVFAIVKETARRFSENKTLKVKANEHDKNLVALKNKDYVEIQGDKAIYKNTWKAGGTEVTWNMVHYDVQLIGGIVLHQGKISEMATGEGKTLVATLPVFLNALGGKGVHLVTVNDYLAKRDAEWMGPLYEFHGLSVDCIDMHDPNTDQRRAAYWADITFGTNNEYGFDYLRDNMAIRPEDLVQRPHNYAIVDEVDSVLIDDARTPLIISGPVPKGDQQEFEQLKPHVSKLVKEQQLLVTKLLVEARKDILAADKETKEKGAIKLLRAYKGLPKSSALIKFLSEEGMKSLLLKTEDIYIAENAKRMPEITDELFFVIDEKTNSVELTDKGHDLLAKEVNEKNFFIIPDMGAAIADLMNSTISDEEKQKTKDQLMADFAIKSERIHSMNQLLKAYTVFVRDVEYVVIENKVKIVDEQTGRIMEGRRYSDGLHQAIEAKEGVKVEAATQTFATITLQNYFRMYRKLAGMTGTAETEAGELWDIYKLDVVIIPTNRSIVRKDSEDLVYKTRKEKYNAVIDEIEKLVAANRSVLVGTTSVEVSELLSRMLTRKKLAHNVLNAKLHKKEADIVAEAGRPGTITIATNMAGRGTDIKLSELVRDSGGLAIIGTERHESRRVDRQLRGRSGRQGDPGSSQFFVSLEDDLMRRFGSERIASVMDRLGIDDGEPIQDRLITKSIERAQKKVEENNFGIRKRLLEYDDVMNAQREVIYKKRRHALHGERIEVDIANMMFDVCQSLVNSHHGNSDFQDFENDLMRTLSIQSPVSEAHYLKMSAAEIIEALYKIAKEKYVRQINAIAEQALPVIRQVYEKQAHQYKNIIVPITDGVKKLDVIVNLEKAYNSGAQEVTRSFEQSILLATIDDSWKEHLREMDELKQSVQNATYEQKDPLLIYKFEAFELFNAMLDKINRTVVSTLLKGRIFTQDPESVKAAHIPKKLDMNKYRTKKDEYTDEQKAQQQAAQNAGRTPEKQAPVVIEKKVGRNDPCPCGSGKKYKQCHGKDL